MRIYSARDEENLHATGLLQDWAAEGFIGESQRLRMREDLPVELRRTNVFLRFVFFLFTLIVAAAATSLFFLFFSPGSGRASGVCLMALAALCYLGAELAVSHWDLYRHGVEEALAVLSVVYLAVGLGAALSPDRFMGSGPSSALSISLSGAVAACLIYRRFGFHYALVMAMIFIALLPQSWTASPAAGHLFVAGIYTVGLIAIMEMRRTHRFHFMDHEHAVAEALLWLGIYAATNLRLSSVDQLRRSWVGLPNPPAYWPPFYWATYALVWCLPLAMLWRALRGRDRMLLRAGLLAALLTLVTNKLYLGWERRPWDPMLLGILLAGVALAARRWLAAEGDGVRRGFTARRLSAKDQWIQNALSVHAGLQSHPAGPAPESNPVFGGGDSAGGGASSNY